MSSGRWYADGSFHGPFPAHGVVDGAREGSVVRCAGEVGHPDDQGGVRRRSSVTFGRRHIRMTIDAALAARGKELFYSQEIGCARCHGVYDGRGNVDWPGVHKDVGTDRSRLDVVSDRFIAAFDRSPLAAEGALVKSRGLRGNATHRRVGELSVPPQRKCADACITCSAPCPSDRRSSMSWRPAASTGHRVGQLLTLVRSTVGWRKPNSSAGLATIATGSM